MLSILLSVSSVLCPGDNILVFGVVGLHCCVWAFSSCSEWEPLLPVVLRLLIAAAALVEHQL